MAKSRVTTEIQGKVISAEDLYERAMAWASGVRAQARKNASDFHKGKNKSYTYKNKTKWHKSGEVEKKLTRAISFKVKEIGGITDRIGFQFPRHGIFRAYGVGNGQSISGKQAKKVFVVRNMSEWIDAPIEHNLNRLADVAAEFYGDQALVKTFGK